MPVLSKIIKVTAAQYDALVDGQTINGHTYDANAFYVIDGGTAIESLSVGTGLTNSGTSTNPTIGIASGYKLPTTTEWSNVNTDAKVQQVADTSNSEYPILIKNSTGSSTTTNGVKFKSNATLNASTGTISSPGYANFTGGIKYLTSAPTSNNTVGGLIPVVLSSEPATKYTGYIYLIVEE